MYRDHTLRLLTLKPLPTATGDAHHEITTLGRACPSRAPQPVHPDSPPEDAYGCSRHRGHTGPHVAAIDPGGTYVAEWDDDRATDDPRGE